MTEAERKRAERAAAVAAFDRMVRARPLRPPPLPRNTSRTRSAGEVELARETRAGMHAYDTLWVKP